MGEACLPVQQAKSIIWIGGSAGSGKSTLGRRMGEYGFMLVDVEDAWAHGDCAALRRESENARLFGDTAFVMPAGCFSQHWETEMQDFVIGVVLLPTEEVYTARWKERERLTGKPDHQAHNLARQTGIAQRIRKLKPYHSVIIDQNTEECVDFTVYRICTQISSL